jgi:hypothetical protein
MNVSNLSLGTVGGIPYISYYWSIVCILVETTQKTWNLHKSKTAWKMFQRANTDLEVQIWPLLVLLLY